MRTYRAINKILKGDGNLSLGIYHTDRGMGVKNFRTASIFEPNPHKGKVGGDGDQKYIIGERRKKKDFNFKAKHTMQALNLLERTCNGKEGLTNKVQSNINGVEPYIHGYKSPKSGLDTWIFNNFNFEIRQKEKGDLSLDVISGSFYVYGSLISSKKIKDVREGLALYEENIVDNSIIRNLQQGVLLERGISKYADLEINEEKLLESVDNVITPEFSEKYANAVKALRPFDISKKVLLNLFTSMLLEHFYSKKK